MCTEDLQYGICHHEQHRRSTSTPTDLPVGPEVLGTYSCSSSRWISTREPLQLPPKLQASKRVRHLRQQVIWQVMHCKPGGRPGRPASAPEQDYPQSAVLQQPLPREQPQGPQATRNQPSSPALPGQLLGRSSHNLADVAGVCELPQSVWDPGQGVLCAGQGLDLAPCQQGGYAGQGPVQRLQQGMPELCCACLQAFSQLSLDVLVRGF